MTREEAIKLANKYDGKCGHRYISLFCDFLEITEDEFWEVAEAFRNPDIWERDGNEWRHKYPLE